MLDEFRFQGVRDVVPQVVLETRLTEVPWRVRLAADKVDAMVRMMVRAASFRLPHGGRIGLIVKNMGRERGMRPQPEDHVRIHLASIGRRASPLEPLLAPEMDVPVDTGRSADGTEWLRFDLAALAPEDLAGTAAGNHRALKVLVVTPYEQVAPMICALLEMLGHMPTVSGVGDDPVRIWTMARQPGEGFDVVLANLLGFGETAAPDLLGRLAAIDPEVHVVVWSASTEHDMMRHWYEYGFAGALPKPFVIRDLDAVLHATSPRRRGLP